MWNGHEHWMNPDNYGKTAEDIVNTQAANDEIDDAYVNWNRNILANSVHFTKGKALSELYGTWKDEKALMVGAGPSSRVKLLQIQKKQKAGWKIVATDRAFKRLKEFGIKPDITITCDAQSLVLGFLDGMDSSDTVAVNIYQNPSLVRALVHRGVNIYWYTLLNPYSRLAREWYEKYNKELFCLRAGYIVGFPATDFCQFMGCRKIALIGNELCWHRREDIEKDIYGSCQFRLYYDPLTKIKYFTIDAFAKAVACFEMFPVMYKDIEWIDCSNGMVKGYKKKDLGSLI